MTEQVPPGPLEKQRDSLPPDALAQLEEIEAAIDAVAEWFALQPDMGERVRAACGPASLDGTSSLWLELCRDAAVGAGRLRKERRLPEDPGFWRLVVPFACALYLDDDQPKINRKLVTGLIDGLRGRPS